MPQDVIAKSEQDWWRLVRESLRKWNAENHEDDNMDIQEWIGELGPKIYGWYVIRDRYGDQKPSLTRFEDDE
jgi:hypothetical protein